MLFGSASGDTTLNNGNYYSWAIGEVIVFNHVNPPTQGIFVAQAMQSYTNPDTTDCFSVKVGGTIQELCGIKSFGSLLNYTVTNPKSSTYDTIQWYYAESDKPLNSDYYKIVGAGSTTYRPYFPGYYKVKLSLDSLNCHEYSTNSIYVGLSSSTAIPYISQDGVPAKTLTVNNTQGKAIQWYAYIENQKRYFLIAGATKSTLSVRYNANYKAIISYDSCEVSAESTVGDQVKSLFRATDVRFDGNTIFIPEEEAYSYSAINVFPNPASGYLTIQYQSSKETVSQAKLYSNTGILVKEINFNEGEYWTRSTHVNVSDLSDGVYFLKVNEGTNQLVHKVIVQK